MRVIETSVGTEPCPRWDAPEPDLCIPDGGRDALEVLDDRLPEVLPTFLTLIALLLEDGSTTSGDVDETWSDVSGLSDPGTMDDEISLICGMILGMQGMNTT